MRFKRFFYTLTLVFFFYNLFSQSEKVSYGSPTDYKIGGIQITGTKYLDPDILISLSGLSVGEEITIPGENISNAIKNLWQQGLFTNVKVYISKTVGSTVFLEINLQERARLSRFALKGVKKGEADDIRDKIKLIKGRVVTENTKMNTAKTIKDFYAEKGYLNAKVTIKEKPDTLLVNSVLLELHINKGKRVKIKEINITGNEVFREGKLEKLMKNTREKAKVDMKAILNKENIKKERLPGTFWDRITNITPTRIYHYVTEKVNLNIFKRSKFIKKEFKNDKEAIIKHYNARGYRDAVITQDSVYMVHNQIKIDMHIDEGDQYYFRDIMWVGNTKYPDILLNQILNIKKGEIYNQELLDERLFMSQSGNDVSSLYMDDGYLFFQITPVEVAVENDSIDLEIRIYEGPQATINEVRIYGNTKTKEHVIRRELRTLPGNKFSRADLIRSQREIANLGYFDPQQMEVLPIPDPEKGTVDIEYHVVEKPSDQLELSAGWGGAGRGVVGTLGLSFTNFSIQNMFKKGTWSPLPTGDGQRLSLRVQTNGVIYQSYNISFTEPWLGGKKPNSFTVGYYHTRVRNEGSRGVQRYIVNGANVSIGTRLKWPDDFFIFSTSLDYERYKLQNWSGNTGFQFRTGTSNNLSLQFTLARSSIDQPLYPTRGSTISLSLKLTPPYSLFRKERWWELSDSEKSELTASEIEDKEAARRFQWVEYHKWRLNAEWFIPLVKSKKFPMVLRFSAKFGFLGRYNKALEHSPFERFELGGDGITNFQIQGRTIIALRGYDAEFNEPLSEGAPFFDKFTLELRFPISLNPQATIYALAFLEGGNVWQDIRNYNPFDIKRSAGLGVRIFLPMFGLLGFDYGIRFDRQYGDPTEVSGVGDYLSKFGKFSIILGFEPE